MFQTLLLIVSALTLATCQIPSNSSRIVGGSDASTGQVPYIASLRLRNSHFCGGTIISTRTVLSAAHCYMTGDVYAVVGTSKLSSGGYFHKVTNFIPHENYRAGSMDYDIAVVIVETPFTFNNFVKPVSLPTYRIPDWSYATTAGWGQTSHPGGIPDNLKWLNVRIISKLNCFMRTGYHLTLEICTLNVRGQGVCFGDSGGPLVANGQVHGVTCGVHPCALGYPDYFTRVQSFNSWIRSRMQY